MKKKLRNLYKTENELCNVLIEYASKNDWIVYPETSNFDILLVKNGYQIGIQAKLKDNIEVLYQAIDYRTRHFNSGPNIRAVLVPQASTEFLIIAKLLKIFVIEALNQKYNRWPFYTSKTILEKKINIDLNNIPNYLERSPKKLCWIPEVQVITPAGVKSPKSITLWKIEAVKLCILLDKNSFLTRDDFKNAKISDTIWKIKKWIVPTNQKLGRLVKYIRNNDILLPDQLYPEIAMALKNVNF